MPSSQNMPPDFATDNSLNCFSVNAKFRCAFQSAFVVLGHYFSYFDNIFGRKFGIVMSLAPFHFFGVKRSAVTDSYGIPSLFLHVIYVILLGSKKKVVGIYARWVVAFMKAKEIFWNFPKHKLPSYSMSQIGSPTDMNPAISSSKLSTDPIPAVRFDLRIIIGVWHRSVFIHLNPEFKNSFFSHKTKSHPAPQKCYRHIDSRNCKTGWKVFLEQCFSGGNSAI